MKFALLNEVRKNPNFIEEVKKSEEMTYSLLKEASLVLSAAGTIDFFGVENLPDSIEKSQTSICKNCEKDIKKSDPCAQPLPIMSYSFYKKPHVRVEVVAKGVSVKTDVPALTLT